MATDATGGGVLERCDRCDGETRYDVRLEIRTESTRSENAAFSREPYRVASCRRCGSESSIRMNDA